MQPKSFKELLTKSSAEIVSQSIFWYPVIFVDIYEGLSNRISMLLNSSSMALEKPCIHALEAEYAAT